MEKQIKKEISELTQKIGDILTRLMAERREHNDKIVEGIFKINNLQRRIADLAENPPE